MPDEPMHPAEHGREQYVGLPASCPPGCSCDCFDCKHPTHPACSCGMPRFMRCCLPFMRSTVRVWQQADEPSRK